MKTVLHKGFWLTVGLLCVLLGIIGFLLPILPGFVFIILALFSFMRCSRRFTAWMERQHWFARLKEAYHRHYPKR